MPLELFSAQWASACCEQLNHNHAYHEAAASWEWPLLLLLTADDPAAERAVLFDLRHGSCRGARIADAADLEHAPYVIAADLASWQRVLQGGLDPLTALMLGKLKLRRGSLSTLARYAVAARQLVVSARAAAEHSA